jgi:8-oxo-dGTP pyrophosphatase MutT (NUDIX family)
MSQQPAGDAPAPSRSSTVVLLREGKQFPEVLMLKRHARSAFGAVHVFPGGVVDSCDSDTHDCCGALSEADAVALLGTGDALDYFSAAIREVFEETGVLLAARNALVSSGPADREMEIAVERRRLLGGEMAWDRFLHDKGLKLSANKLHYFAHWVTPIGEPKRFSTRFFLAAMPEGQQASHDGRELTDSCWLTAVDILDSQRAGHMHLIYPTYRTLKDIAKYKTVDDVIAWAVARQQSGVARLLPAISDVDGRDKVVLPGDPRYPGEGLA